MIYAAAATTLLLALQATGVNIEVYHGHQVAQEMKQRFHIGEYNTQNGRHRTTSDTLWCAVKNFTQELPVKTQCHVNDEEQMGHHPHKLACMGLFTADGVPLEQGCWSHQPEGISEACKHNRCEGDERDGGLYWCCCLTDMCNQHVTLPSDL